jgi:hypothetical protein
MLQAGVILPDYATLMVEILKDNARPEAGEVYGAMDMPWAKLVGQIAQALREVDNTTGPTPIGITTNVVAFDRFVCSIALVRCQFAQHDPFADGLPSPYVGILRGTTSLATSTWTTSPTWSRVSLRTVTMPRSGRDRDGRTSRISLST